MVLEYLEVVRQRAASKVCIYSLSPSQRLFSAIFGLSSEFIERRQRVRLSSVAPLVYYPQLPFHKKIQKASVEERSTALSSMY